MLISPDALLAQSALLGAWIAVWPYLVMLLGFSVIVFVHELGHFLVAKMAGVRVERFAIGFGRELFGVTRGETRYSFNILPLGGYVKMLGQEDFDDKSEELRFKEDPRSFANKPVGHRMAIVSAGVVMNILFAFFLFMIVFMIGMEVEGTHIGFVDPDSPADKAGLLPGDDIKEVNGSTIREFAEVRMAILLAPPHTPIEFVVERDDGAREHLPVRPETNTEQGRLQVGIAEGRTREIVQVGPEIDTTKPDSPHIGDVLVEIGGRAVTDANINEARRALAFTAGNVVVERKDPQDPHRPPERATVRIPPILQLYPSGIDDNTAVNILGLTPLVRFDLIKEGGRAWLAGIGDGDTVLSWDDIKFPTRGQIARAISHNPGRDMEFTVLKANGRTLRGFIRPKPFKKAAPTIQAYCKDLPDAERTSDGPQAVFAEVTLNGMADEAGIEEDDLILRWAGVDNPSAAVVNRSIRENAGEKLAVRLRKPNGREVFATVIPQPPGTIQAGYSLLANDLLNVGVVADTIDGKPSPAALAGVPTGALLTAVNGREINTWCDLIDRFREHAGTTVEIAYRDTEGSPNTFTMAIPHCLRTKLGLGPEARICRIDGREKVRTPTARREENVAVGYHIGTRTILKELVGRKRVPIEYRENLLSEVKTAYVDVTADMVDPWLGRVEFWPNIEVDREYKILQGKNALDAVWIGVRKTHYFVLQVYQSIHRMVFSRTVGVENMSGPLGIVALGGDVARSGFTRFLFFMAIISANLAVINFLPLPIVDGGLMIFLIIEKIKGSPVSLRVQVATQMIGMFLILSAFIFVTFNDVLKIWN